MIVISAENELPEYVGYENCIEHKIKSGYNYLTIPVQIKTRDMKIPSSIFGTIKSCLRYVLWTNKVIHHYVIHFFRDIR